MNIEQFNNEIDARLQTYLDTCVNPTRQSIATKRGQLIEEVAYDLLINHPLVENVDSQVYDYDVDEFSKIDLVVSLKNGKVVYIPCARDLWLGTSQQDRLQLVYLKHKLWQENPGLFPPNSHYCYLCSDDYRTFLEAKTAKTARRKKKLQEVVKNLSIPGTITNIESLLEFINKVGQ